MRPQIRRALVGVYVIGVFIIGQPEICSPRELFSPPSGQMWLQSGIPDGPRPRYYGATSRAADWAVGQWNTPEDLPEFRGGETQNKYSHVKLEAGNRYLLEQDGSTLSCEKVYASGASDVHEFDLLVSAINRNSPEYPQAARGEPAILDQIKHLYLSISVEPTKIDFVSTDCRVTRALFMTSVTLVNLKARQTLFYQLRLGVFQKEAGKPATALSTPFWFAEGYDPRTNRKGYYGYDDNVTSYGVALVAEGTRSSYSVDLLRRLGPIIREGAAYGMDQDLSKWSVRGTYHGQAIWGKIRVSSLWNGFKLMTDE